MGRTLGKMMRTNSIFLSSYAKKKYFSFPPTTPPPSWEQYLIGPQWTFWEWWSGKGTLTKAMSRQVLANGQRAIVGPPISHETGWDLNLPTHQSALKQLQLARKPKILFFAPTCGPWSQSNTTMASEDIHEIRTRDMCGIAFLCESAAVQVSHGNDFTLEQPKTSELLSLDSMLKLLNFESSLPDQHFCMCCHGLTDPFNNKPCMKPSTLRGTIPLKKVDKWCICPPGSHQRLQGRLPDGRLRTEVAQAYPKLLCARLAHDFTRHLNLRAGEGRRQSGNTTNNVNDNKTKDNKRKRKHAHKGAYPADKETSSNSSSSSDSSDTEQQQIIPQPSPDIEQQPIPPPPGLDTEQQQVQVRPNMEPTQQQQLLQDELDVVMNLIRITTPRLGDSGLVILLETNTSIRPVQTTFGNQNNMKIQMCIVARRPASMPSPEPSMARDSAPWRLVIAKASGEHPWQKLTWQNTNDLEADKIYPKFRTKPAYMVVCYAKEQNNQEVAIAPAPAETISLLPESLTTLFLLEDTCAEISHLKPFVRMSALTLTSIPSF
jgi:hypothetical protein